MPDTENTINDILQYAKETLETAEYGLKDLIGTTAERKLPGLRNLVVFGRAVTNVLQTLRNKTPKFEKWYERYVKEMESDPLMRYFYSLRSQILKEGSLKTSTHTHIIRLHLPEDLNRFPPPPNAKGFFIGDNIGGSGWEVQLLDGSIQKYYVELPADIGTVSLHFPEPPASHMGKEISDLSIEALSSIYIDYLCKMLDDAEKEFND